jgi:HSP20 family protein
MNPFIGDRDRWKKNPFDFFDIDDEFYRIFSEMEKMMERIFGDFSIDWLKRNKSFVHDFNIDIGPDGRPRIQEFGNRPLKTPEGDSLISDEREPLIDIIEGDEEVSITVEIPGVEKEEIDLNVTENNLEINVNNSQRKYYKLLFLPCEVVPKTTEATYKNGILDVVIKRKERRKKEKGFRVKIE